MGLVNQVQQTILQHRLLEKEDTIIVAVSGGPDSTALLHVLHKLSERWGWQIVIAHLNHQLRGSESDAEAQQVRKMGAALGWPCEVSEVDVLEHMTEQAISVQVAARQLRYNFLMRVAQQYEAQAIATGHHADDQAETILMRMVRGTGPSGLSGIPIMRNERNKRIIRPLLHSYKEDIVQYCQTHQLAYQVDSSNSSRAYTRNQVRLDMLPYLQQWNDNLPQALNQLSQIISEENHYIEEETQKKFNELVKNINNQYIFSKNHFLILPIALQRRLIKLILNYLCLEQGMNDFPTVERLRQAICQRKKPTLCQEIDEQHELYMSYDDVRIGLKQTEERQDYSYAITTFPIEQPLPEAAGIMKVAVLSADDADFTKSHHDREAYFDLHQLALPLHIRNRRPGDRMRIIGLNGSKKVKDIFIDEKIPPAQRVDQPIIVDHHGQLLWMPGLRRADAALVTGQTKQIIHMKYEQNIDHPK